MSSTIDAYVTSLASATTGRPTRRTPRLLQEARDHLEDAALAGQARGLSRHQAEIEAVSAFGAVEQVAPAYRAALGLTRVRTAAISLLFIVILQPLVWAGWGYAEGEPTATGPGLVLNDLIEFIGIAYLVACPITLAACSAALRGPERTIMVIRIFGGLALLTGASVMVLALGLNALAPQPVDLLFTTVVTILPMSATLTMSTRGLRLISP
ncbi:MAG: permease prefix domain 1-containing protein [Nocardioides sp.]|nr:permease prefix domain 1-containing protein [Nocardioides sp.]